MDPMTPEISPTESARRRPPRAVRRANGSASAAAPKTALVCASPARVSELVIDETKREPAATVPATPTPLNTWAVASVLTTRRWC